LLLAIVAVYSICIDSVVLTHPFWAACSSVLSCRTSRTPSKLSSSTFLHSCRGSCLLERDAYCSHDPVCQQI